MKELMLNIYNKHKKYVIMIGTFLCIIIIALLSWNLVLVKYKDFATNESKFLKAAKRYYEYHKQQLPKDGESREITLQELYNYNQIDDLYAPKTRKMCDVNSWVRVYKENDDYKYITYLKCGRFASRIDHEGPVITLNGDEEISIPLNSEYKELGVKEVNDNKDGKIDVNNVIIDSSDVNVKKIGTYKVTYTIKDSKYNKTVAVRKIIVAKGLTDTIKSITSTDSFIKGNDKNNYVLFSGMLWRAFKVNADGTVKLILNEPVANLRANYTEYKNSNIDNWLNDIFYKALAKSDKYIEKSTYCVGSINSMSDYNNYCSEKIEEKIGLLDIDEYYNTFINNASSILSRSFMLGHMINDNYADATSDEDKPDGTKNSILAPIRPVITLKNDLNIASGDGTYTNPYKLNDYSYANKTDRINTRLIGEYLEYSGLVFRIIDIDEQQNVRLILNGEWTIAPNNATLYISTEKIKKWEFNMDDENNPAYIINNDFLDYINAKNIVSTTYEIPVNNSEEKYNEYKVTKVNAKIVLPKTYDLFSNVGDAKYVYAYLDNSTSDNMLFMANTANGKVFELGKDDFTTYSVKPVITLKGNLRIESGNGTVNSPYKLK